MQSSGGVMPHAEGQAIGYRIVIANCHRLGADFSSKRGKQDPCLGSLFVPRQLTNQGLKANDQKNVNSNPKV
ncbi:hypothetical protein TIFTF001_051930 [Ficus carica]|uniref:Uncharacterized protein n=1 Tax=Ficus carica TaxID=3494 RepID=A0AA88ECA0_FICCA|nr:hypothetical protein TIFTF001_051930 [Ficus carica]